MIITVRFSTDNDPTPKEIDWVRKAIRDKLEERGELRDPKILSVSTESEGIIYPPHSVLTEELWQAIKKRMNQEQRMMPEPAQHLPHWSNPDPYNRGPSATREVIDPTSTSGRRTVF